VLNPCSFPCCFRGQSSSLQTKGFSWRCSCFLVTDVSNSNPCFCLFVRLQIGNLLQLRPRLDYLLAVCTPELARRLVPPSSHLPYNILVLIQRLLSECIHGAAEMTRHALEILVTRNTSCAYRSSIHARPRMLARISRIRRQRHGSSVGRGTTSVTLPGISRTASLIAYHRRPGMAIVETHWRRPCHAQRRPWGSVGLGIKLDNVPLVRNGRRAFHTTALVWFDAI